MKQNWFIGIVIGVMMLSCSPRAVREAKSVVAQADSLWRAGMPCGDSIALAQAFTTLDTYQYLYPDDYAHACYHYGRLLREKENPVEAMLCFIHATHSHTRDYHILGRVYSNMGDICHLANEFDLSYDMFERSADMFLQNGDSLAYYYALNDMAFELAEQGKKDSCFVITENIKDHNPTESTLISYCNISQAQACLKCKQYDSVIFYVHQSRPDLQSIPSSILQLAQTYSYLEIKDSAVLYARQVLLTSNALSDINNALYILTNDDHTESKDAIRKTAADRSDTQKLLEIRRSKMSQAVQLLQQDLTRKPNLNWLYSLLAALCTITVLLYFYIHKKQKAHQLLSQKIQALKSEEATSLTQRRKQVEANCALFVNSPTIKVDLGWNNYAMLCKCIDAHFFMLAEKLKQMRILNEQEVRLCILVLLNISRNQIADILPYAQNGVGKLKYRVAKKLQIEGKNLRKYLICIAIDKPYQ